MMIRSKYNGYFNAYQNKLPILDKTIYIIEDNTGAFTSSFIKQPNLTYIEKKELPDVDILRSNDIYITNNAIRNAIKTNNLFNVVILFEDIKNKNYINTLGLADQSLLMYAIQYCTNDEIIRFVLYFDNVNINYKDNRTLSALAYAFLCGKDEVFKLLLEIGANITDLFNIGYMNHCTPYKPSLDHLILIKYILSNLFLRQQAELLNLEACTRIYNKDLFMIIIEYSIQPQLFQVLQFINTFINTNFRNK